MIIKNSQDVPARDVDSPGADGVKIRLLIHQAEAAPNFFMRQFDVAPGGCTPRHKHDWEHEVYVLHGTGVVWTHQGDRDIHAGDVVYIPPDEEHQFRNSGAGVLSFLCIVPRTN